jgi:polyisoprenoid-binding protein YceI
MKKRIQNLLLVAIIMAATLVVAQSKQIDIAQSSIKWVGTKVISGSHEGIMNFKSGFLNYSEGVITGGEFVVDMTSINCTDLEGEYKGKLEGHLKSDDFFGTENHPESTLTITEIKQDADGTYNATGDFTIKGITQNIPFKLNAANDVLTAEVVVDRSKHNIRYGSGSFFDNLGDRAISDDFKLTVTLKL